MKMRPEDIVRNAAAAFNSGKPDEALRLCEDGLRRWPNEPTLNHFLAAVLFAKGEFQLARGGIEASLRAAPQHLPARLLAARIAQADKDLDAALAYLGQPDPAAAAPELLLERARVLSQMDRRNDARTAWRAVLQAVPQTHPIAREAMARLGRLSWEDGNLTDAAALLERAVAGDCPASTWFDLGVVRSDLHDYAGAATAYGQALTKKPDYAEAAVNLGVALQESGDLDGALAAYGTAYRLRPSTFGTIAMALTSSPHGRLWLDEAALRRSLGG